MKKLTKFLIASVLLLTGAYGLSNSHASEVKEVEAASLTTKWALIGKVCGTSWNKDIPLTYNETSSRFEVTCDLNSGDEFKFRYNGAWTKEIGYDNNFNGTSNIKTYLNNSSGNFKVKTSGNYTLCLDGGIESWTSGYAWAFTIIKNEVQTVDVTYYNGSNIIGTDENLTMGVSYNPISYNQTDYRLEGWYTDSALTQKFDSGTAITTDTNLYGKYIEAVDYKIYLEPGTTKANYVYMWHSHTGKKNSAWPGKQLTLNGNGLYEINITAEEDYTHVIFNDGNESQTADLKLTIENGALYTLSSDWDYTLTSTNFMVGQIDVQDETLGTAYKFFSALPTLVATKTNDKDEYNVGLKFEFIKKDETEVSATGYYTCSNLETLTYDADGVDGAEEHTAATDNYKTFFAVTVYEIPEDYVGGSVIVTPAYQNSNGHTVMCIAKTFAI